MTEDTDHDSRIEDEAEGLIERLYAIVDELIQALPGNGSLSDKEGQFDAVSRSIQELERQGIDVPNDLRDKKIDLYGDIGCSREINEMLANIEDSLVLILNRIRNRRKLTKKRTPDSEIKSLILKLLQKDGGQVGKQEVLEWIELNMRDVFLPGDLEPGERGKEAWVSCVDELRLLMAEEGLIKNDLPFGFWELSDQSIKSNETLD